MSSLSFATSSSSLFVSDSKRRLVLRGTVRGDRVDEWKVLAAFPKQEKPDGLAYEPCSR